MKGRFYTTPDVLDRQYTVRVVTDKTPSASRVQCPRCQGAMVAIPFWRKWMVRGVAYRAFRRTPGNVMTYSLSWYFSTWRHFVSIEVRRGRSRADRLAMAALVAELEAMGAAMLDPKVDAYRNAAR